MKRLSAVSEVVLFLRGQPMGSTITMQKVKDKTGVEPNKISAALHNLYEQGYLEYVDTVDRGAYEYRLIKWPTDYPLRNAPRFAPRQRPSGIKQQRIDGNRKKSGKWTKPKPGQKGTAVRTRRDWNVVNAELDRLFEVTVRLTDRIKVLQKKLGEGAPARKAKKRA